MRTSRKLGLALVTAFAAVLVGVPPALAAVGGNFTCRASVLRISGAPATVEPVVANPARNPCRVEQKGPGPVSGENDAGSGQLNAAEAATDGRHNDPPVDGDHAVSSVKGADVLLVSGNTEIRASGVSARVTVTCQGGMPVPDDTSSVSDLVVDGEPVDIGGGESRDIELANGVLHVNARIAGNTAVVRRALWFEGVTGDVIAGEADTGVSGNPCQEGTTSSPPPPSRAWACRASAGKAFSPVLFAAGTTGGFEPVVASRSLTPCSGQTVGLAPDAKAGPVHARDARAITTRSTDEVRARTHVADGRIVAPGLEITVDTAAVEAHARCTEGALALSATSRVTGLRVNGQPVVVSDTRVFDDQAFTLTVPGGMLHVNDTIDLGERITRRAVWLNSLAGDQVLGEAIVGLSGGC